MCGDIHPGRIEPAFTDEGAQGSNVLCELSRDVYPVIYPSCVAEDSRTGEGLQVYADRGCPRLQRGGVGSSRPLIGSPSSRFTA